MHDQTMVKWWSYHDRPWSTTMIDHGQTMADRDSVTGVNVHLKLLG